MQSLNEYVCMDCGNTSDCASDLLKHFTQHVKVDDANFFIAENSKQSRKSTIPDLYPISVFKELHSNSNASPLNIKTDAEEEDLSPTNYCETMLGKTKGIVPNDSQHTEENKTKKNEDYRRLYDHKCIKQSLLKKHRLIDAKESQVQSDCEKLKPHLKRKQQKCSIKRKSTKFVVQSGINSLLCST